MFENIVSFFKKLSKKNNPKESSTMAKERLHLVLMQDRANVSVDFLELMRQEIIEVIKKYIDIDEKAIDVKLTNKTNEDGTIGAPALYANIPIITIKDEARKLGNAQANVIKDDKKENNTEKQEKQNKEKANKEIEKKDNKQNEEKQDETNQEETNQNEEKQDEAKNDETKNDEIKQDETKIEEAKTEELQQEETEKQEKTEEPKEEVVSEQKLETETNS